MQISFTLSTIPLLLLAAYLWHRSKGQLMPIAMFMSVFQAASIVNLGIGSLQIGVQPTYFILMIALLVRLGGRRPANSGTWSPNTSTTLILAGFVAYATVSAFVFPTLFKGVPFSNPKLGSAVPLKWELGHLNQLFYLLLSFALYLVAAYWTSPAELIKSANWFVSGVAFASLLGFYQFVSVKTGLPFPTEFLHTSPTYSIFKAYEIDGFPRMNSTFTEASAAAFSMTVALAMALWRLISRADSLRNIAYVCVIGTGLLITVSTTGYVCLLFLSAIMASRYFVPFKASADSRNARIFLAIPIVLVLFCALGVAPVRDSVVKLAHTVLLDKTKTNSYQERTAWNNDALRTASGTHWLGAGWGICRASSFVPTMLGNVGIPGSILFFAFCACLFRPILQRGRFKIPFHGAALVALSAVLLDLVVSTPELGHPIAWLLFAVAAKLAAGRPPVLLRPMVREAAA